MLRKHRLRSGHLKDCSAQPLEEEGFQEIPKMLALPPFCLFSRPTPTIRGPLGSSLGAVVAVGVGMGVLGGEGRKQKQAWARGEAGLQCNLGEGLSRARGEPRSGDGPSEVSLTRCVVRPGPLFPWPSYP